MTQKMFEADSEPEAQRLADEWLRSQPGIHVLKRFAAQIPKMFDSPFRSTRCAVTIEYEDGSN
jgi:hypothetical protein